MFDEGRQCAGCCVSPCTVVCIYRSRESNNRVMWPIGELTILQKGQININHNWFIYFISTNRRFIFLDILTFKVYFTILGDLLKILTACKGLILWP